MKNYISKEVKDILNTPDSTLYIKRYPYQIDGIQYEYELYRINDEEEGEDEFIAIFYENPAPHLPIIID